MDKLNEEQRSNNMRRIKSKDTVPELLVRRALRGESIRYTQVTGHLPGKPDFLVCEGQVAIFVHGCFWHQHAKCADGRKPKSRIEYWCPKLDGNVSRDRRVRRKLRNDGIGSIVVWECQTAPQDLLARRLAAEMKRLRVRRRQRAAGI